MTDINLQGDPEVAAVTRTLRETLAGMTPDQAEQHVLDNVTDLDSAKNLMSKMARVLVALVKRAE